MGQGHGSCQAAFGPASSGYGKPQQALLIRQQGEEAVVFPQGFAAEGQPLNALLRHATPA